MRLSGSERDPGLLGSAQSSTVMQACQEVPCSRRGLALLVVPALSSQCGTFSKPEFFQQTQSWLRASSEATVPDGNRRAQRAGACVS